MCSGSAASFCGAFSYFVCELPNLRMAKPGTHAVMVLIGDCPRPTYNAPAGSTLFYANVRPEPRLKLLCYAADALALRCCIFLWDVSHLQRVAELLWCVPCSHRASRRLRRWRKCLRAHGWITRRYAATSKIRYIFAFLARVLASKTVNCSGSKLCCQSQQGVSPSFVVYRFACQMRSGMTRRHDVRIMPLYLLVILVICTRTVISSYEASSRRVLPPMLNNWHGCCTAAGPAAVLGSRRCRPAMDFDIWKHTLETSLQLDASVVKGWQSIGSVSAGVQAFPAGGGRGGNRGKLKAAARAAS